MRRNRLSGVRKSKNNFSLYTFTKGLRLVGASPLSVCGCAGRHPQSRSAAASAKIAHFYYFVQLYGRQKIEAAVSPLKALIQKSKLCFLYIKFPLRSQFKICLHLIESGQQDNL